jgi:DNA invertase Pin-like site-specific DNA recombinase
MTRRPAGYIRRSSVDARNPGAFSESAQRDAITALAVIDGHPAESIVWYRDWGISGGKNDRPDYQRLRTDVQAGTVSHVYALNLSRIGRSLGELIAFEALCRQHDCALVLARDPVNTGSASGRMLYAVLAAIAQMMRELAEEAQAATLEERRERGDVLGHPNFGMVMVWDGERHIEERDTEVDIEPLRRAYDEAGSVAGAVRLLNEWGIPSRRGKVWHLSAYRRALAYHWPGLLESAPRSQANGKSSMVLSKLLKCHCGTVLTPNQARGQYYCHRARTVADHGKGAIKEAKVLDWVKAEADRLSIPYEVVLLADERDSERAKLLDRLERLSEQHEMGTLPTERLRERTAAIQFDLDRLDDAEKAAAIPDKVAWDDWTVEAINAVLRALWETVELGADLMPVRAIWTVPQWRAS